MDKDQSKVSYFTAFLREFTTVFTLMVLVFSMIYKLNIISAPEIQNMSIIVPGGDGLPYNTIMQITGFSLIIAAVIRLLFSGFLAVKIPFLWRYSLFFLAVLFTSSTFAVVFKWFPADNLYAWLRFILAFFVSFSISIGLSLLVIKLKNKKYNKLLANYKRRHKN